MYLQFETDGMVCTERIDGVFFLPKGTEDHMVNPFDDEDFLVSKTTNHWMVWPAEFSDFNDGRQIARKIIVNRAFCRADRIESFASVKAQVPPVRRFRPESDGISQLIPRDWGVTVESFDQLEQRYRAKVDVGSEGPSPVHVSRAFQLLYAMLEHR